MENSFSKLHPRLCFLYFIVSLIASMLFKHPIYLYTLLMVSIVLNWSLDGGKALSKVIKNYLLMAAIIFILNPIFSSRGATILFYLFDNPVTFESIAYGAQLSISFLTVLILFVAYNLVVTPDKFLFLFGSFLPKTSFIITVTLRFVPLLKRRLAEINTVQKVKGSFQVDSPKRLKIIDGMETLHTLITWSLEEALQTANSMRARGYGVRKRSSAVRYTMNRLDFTLMWIMLTLGLFILIGGFLGVGQYEVYPQIQKIEMTSLTILHFICFSLFLLIPLFLIGKEIIEWYIIKLRM